jgi:hypothetical protein
VSIARRRRTLSAAVIRRAVVTAMLLANACLSAPTFAAAPPTRGAIEHLRGIYLQRAIEVATVGSRTIVLARMTRFRRCGRFRGVAEDFNEHLVDVAGRDVDGIGFVAGLVTTLEGCSRPHGPADRQPIGSGGPRG